MMNYATTYNIGQGAPTPGAKAKAIAPTTERLRQLDAKTKGFGRNQEGQTTVSADSNAANGFLRTSFLPRLAATETIQACKETVKTEKDFYQSLSVLAEHYDIKPMQTETFGYPYNIALALWDTEEQLLRKIRNWEEIKLLQDSKRTYLTSEERYNTGSTLYYIPVIPLYRLLRNPRRKSCAHLLLSVCTYLYHVADIPYYRQEDSFLYWQYEMLKEWVLSDDYTDETSEYLNELEQADWIGERMEQKIINRANLKVFKQRLNRFTSKDALDLDCYVLACEAYTMYEKFPHDTVFRNASTANDADEDEMDDIVSMDRYISFCGDSKGWLGDNIIQCVNNELQEYGQMQEPVIIKRFNASKISGDNLDFENRLFALMEELIYILNNF